MNEKLIDIRELSRHTGLPVSWFYERTRERTPFQKNRIPFIKCGKYIRFRLSEVMAWLEAQQKQA